MFCEIFQCLSVNRGKDSQPQQIEKDSERVFKGSQFPIKFRLVKPSLRIGLLYSEKLIKH